MYTKNIRYFTALLLICFVIGFAVSILPVNAITPFEDAAYALDIDDRIALYLDAANAFESADDKLATMEEKITRGNYTLYVDESTAEVAVKNNVTGQVLMTNPFDLATTSSVEVKRQLMSQVVITFQDLANSGVTKTFYSFSESASRGQIEVKNIKNGLRVEYTLGKQSARRLLPRWMEKERWETLLYDYINKENQASAIRFRSFYTPIDPNKPDLPEKTRKEYNIKYPCTKDKYTSDYGEFMGLYAIAADVTEREENVLEGYIKQYCPHYNYEELEYDHELTKYQGLEKSPAIFRLALEYYLSENGLKAVVPANSIRFDEEYYRLTSVSVLQYFGASANDYTGYTFIPDGSGAIIRNEEIMSDGKNTYTVSGQVYGADFAYHEIKGFNGKSEIMRLPVFGVVQDTVTVGHNFNNQLGYVTIKKPVTEIDETTGEEKEVLYTSEDRIMVDAYDNRGYLILSLEDYFGQYQYIQNEDQSYSVIKKGDSKWDSVGYNNINDDETYQMLFEAGLVPYYEAVEHYMMSPLVLTKKYSDEEIEFMEFYGYPIDTSDFVRETKPLTMIERDNTGAYKTAFDYITYNGDIVFVYVNEVGELVDEANRVAGVFKIKVQLYYNGQPAYYDTNVPINPDVVIEPETPDAGEGTEGEGTEGETPEGETPDGETPEGETPEGETPEGETPEGGEGTEEEEEVVIEYYNQVVKTEETYENPAYEEFEEIVSEGFFAYMEDGAALTQLTSTHGAKDPTNTASTGLHKYNSVYATFFPRPTDSYRLSDSISVGSSDMWTVVCDRKYTGNYTINFVMLSDKVVTDENGKEQPYKYEASYIGMANAYRDYLTTTGTLAKLEKVEDDIPLYLELLGVTEVQKNILTIPVMMDTALTSFKNIEEIYNKLSTEAGIDNIRARLTGFAKDGMFQRAPSALKFEKVVGGNKGYINMVEFCESVTSADGKSSLKVYPDFDFANLHSTALFDGISTYNDMVKTMDDRYVGKREYSATYQSFQRMGSMCISPAAYEKIYKKFSAKLDKLAVSGLSFSTLGTDLNSDFNEDDPYNRDDTMNLTIELLDAIYKDYGKIMINGGNSYALGYASDVLYMSLDSSRYMRASAAVPFMGILLHGYVNYAGDPTNTAGDIYYETLKIIENGASPFFLLAAQHTEAIKESGWLSQYYAVDYEIWYEDIVETYNILNEALGDVQSATITDHGFLEAKRVFSEKELAKIAEIKAEAIAGFEQAKLDAEKAYNDRKVLAERHGEEFTEVFEETYEYLTGDAEKYAEYMVEQYTDTIKRDVKLSSVVYVTYTRPDGTSKTFILNYAATDIEVTYGEKDYVIKTLDFQVIEN